MYWNRSDKELKYDFAIRGFSSQKFYATEASFRFALVAYNVLSLFRLIVPNLLFAITSTKFAIASKIDEIFAIKTKNFLEKILYE